jgi:nitroreductase
MAYPVRQSGRERKEEVGMNFQELIRRRYSVRAYRPEPVSEEALERVLEAGRLAPTAANRQPFRVVVLHAAGRQEALARLYDRRWFTQAPVVLCVCGVPEEAWVRRDGRSHLDVDAAIVMDHLILAATDEGLGTCWIANFDVGAAREVFAVRAGEVPLLLTPLGHAADQPKPRERRRLDELVRHIR